MERLQNTIQEYAWGSQTAISGLLGQPRSSKPQAELWLGAHPLAPSATPQGSLLALIDGDPVSTLGARVAQRFQNRLPFLLKVLAADAPLSLQAHPSLAQAQAGFAREEAAGVPLTAAHRNYKDANHKPELICALTPFEALCGFRKLGASARLFAGLGHAVTTSLSAVLQLGGLAGVFETLMTMPKDRTAALLASVVPQLEKLSQGTGDEAVAYRCAHRLAQAYPGDIGAVSSLLLNHVELSVGQALYLDAGNLHAYLRGVGIELMANSDNVLRGGLTPKHVDVKELLGVLDFSAGPVKVLEPTEAAPGEWTYATAAADFRLSRFSLSAAHAVKPARSGPEILLCTEGTATVEMGNASLTLKRGESAWVAAADGAYTASGNGVLYRATVGTL
ncbi:MAG: mannose-6-phosphate isomerase, class I [Myxococcaceae bacterium]|nr:mannose-6-phosphate isomerase, class I [Myxococcaceae bacterium]